MWADAVAPLARRRPFLVVELRVRDPGYAEAHQIVRAAHHVAGTYAGICLLPSYDAPLMPGQRQPHVSVEGLEVVGRRAVQAGLSMVEGKGCP